jgi:recombination protein RecA
MLADNIFLKIIDKSGAWYSYNGDRIGQGKDNAREYLRANPAIALDIENRIRTAKGVAQRNVAAAAVE